MHQMVKGTRRASQKTGPVGLRILGAEEAGRGSRGCPGRRNSVCKGLGVEKHFGHLGDGKKDTVPGILWVMKWQEMGVGGWVGREGLVGRAQARGWDPECRGSLDTSLGGGKTRGHRGCGHARRQGSAF